MENTSHGYFADYKSILAGGYSYSPVLNISGSIAYVDTRSRPWNGWTVQGLVASSTTQKFKFGGAAVMSHLMAVPGTDRQIAD